MFLGVMVRDVLTQDWIRRTEIHYLSGTPFPTRYVPSILFRHYPALGIAFTILLSFVAAAAIQLAAIAAVNALRRRFRFLHGDAPEETTEYPPVTQTIPPPRPSTPP
jgi:hypothetical protein